MCSSCCIPLRNICITKINTSTANQYQTVLQVEHNHHAITAVQHWELVGGEKKNKKTKTAYKYLSRKYKD